MVVRVALRVRHRNRSRGSFQVLVRPVVVGMMVGLMSLGIPLAVSTHVDATTGISATDHWYQRYPYYPPYCATPDEMAAWSVPPLSSDQSVLRVTGETRLLHVTAVARHGARTPYTPSLNCWEDYATNPETAVWNCALHTYLSTPPSTANNIQDSPLFLLEKRYDALHEPMSNYLNGTCQVGQLLEPGYEQELRNGQFLRDAYVYTEGTFDHDKRMRLLGVGSQANGNVWDYVHYRVDDESRTTQSGQVILQGLFGPEMTAHFVQHQSLPVIPLHTADYNRDVLEPNEDVCPHLTEIRTRNEASPEYKAYNQSNDAVLLRHFQKQVLRIPDRSRDMDAIDCLMTTMCTDRPLPEAVNDYRPAATAQQNETAWSEEYGHDLLQRLYDFETKLYVLNAKAENAEYSKLGMSFLWNEIMTKLNAHVRRNDHSVSHNYDDNDDSGAAHEKLLLIAGHDTTIIPLLATLGVWNDTTWPTYASMILLELHQLNIDGKTSRKIFRSDYAFRLIYNGAVITSQIPKCPFDLELCDLSVLQELVITTGDCTGQHAATVPYQDAVTRTREIVSSPQGFIYLLLLVSGSAVAGGVAVFVYLSHGTLPDKQSRYLRTQQRPSYEDEGSLYNESGNGYHDDSEDPSEQSLT
jgi:Histidine phosphatase superfamily (branch 2)